MTETFPMQEVDPNTVGDDERANHYRALEIRVAIQQAKAIQAVADALKGIDTTLAYISRVIDSNR